MSIPFYTSINHKEHPSYNFVIQRLSVPPLGPKVGRIYYNTREKHFYGWNGNKWQLLSFEGDYKGTYEDLEDIDFTPKEENVVGIEKEDYIQLYIYLDDKWVSIGGVRGLNEVTQVDNTTSVKIVGDQVFQGLDQNDFIQKWHLDLVEFDDLEDTTIPNYCQELRDQLYFDI